MLSELNRNPARAGRDGIMPHPPGQKVREPKRNPGIKRGSSGVDFFFGSGKSVNYKSRTIEGPRLDSRGGSGKDTCGPWFVVVYMLGLALDCVDAWRTGYVQQNLEGA